MKIGFVKINNRGKVNFPKGKTMFVILMVIMLIGVFIGSLAAGGMENVKVSRLFCSTSFCLDGEANIGFLRLFCISFGTTGAILAVCFLAGLCAVGQPAGVAALLYRGIGIGAAVAYLYTSNGFRGLAVTMLLIVPSAVISSFALILAAREEIRFSNEIAAVLIGKKDMPDGKSALKLYILKFLVLFVIIIISSLIDAALAMISTIV